MKCSLGISNSLDEISSLSHSIVFLYFFALIAEEVQGTLKCLLPLSYPYMTPGKAIALAVWTFLKVFIEFVYNIVSVLPGGEHD